MQEMGFLENINEYIFTQLINVNLGTLHECKNQ